MSNDAIKQALMARAETVQSLRVRRYIPELIVKIDQAGSAAGVWLEQLETHFDELKPEGLMEGFDREDYDDLWFVLTGQRRPTG